MACIKSVNRSASAAFAPDGGYVAAGTMAGAVDLSFSSSASLEIFKLDFQSDAHDLPVVGESTSSERFNRLSWGRNPSSPGSEEFSLGLIAGGLVDGNIGLWNPRALIRSEASENALVTQLTRHKGPVRGLEFNALTPNHLASGADEGEICIWDIAKPSEPTHFPPLKGSGSATQGEISYLSWNSKVQHILASTSYNGTTVVWDLKRQKPALSFPDPYRRRCSVLQWHPDLATQLIVASDDDSSPSLRLWDMRNTMLPVREFAGHSKGVIAMSWCQSDSSYLLTCAKDNRTVCWDTVSGEIVTELPAGTNWNFDVHWYPKIPGVISASSFDGKIGIYNIEGCSRFGTEEGSFTSAPLRAPKWYKSKAGVSFGFGGKLVSFCSMDSPAGASEVYVHKLVAEDSLVHRSSEFEAAIHNRDRSSLRLLCERKTLESESEDNRETWGFLKVMFEDDGTARTKLLTHFGFSLPLETKDTMENDLSQEVSGIILEDKAAAKEEYVVDKTAYLYDNGEDFFNNLPSPKAETPVSNSGGSFKVDASDPIVEEIQQEMDGQEECGEPSFDDAIQCALVVGDYKGAVAHCIAAKKMADALVIAHVGGGSLWESTRDQYLKMSRSPYLKVVSAMVNNDLASLVNTRPLKSWKETLALLCTFAQGEEWSSLCDSLASRLMAVGNTLPATLCYMCAGNVDKTVEIWSQNLTSEYAGRSYVDHLQDLMEKTIVLALAIGQKQFSASLCKLVEKYAEILASQGILTTAMEYLKLMGTEELSPELMILQDRIARSTEIENEVPKSSALNSQSQPGTTYGADHSSFGAVESSQHYYQETAPSQQQPTVSGSPYGGNYQPPFGSPYTGGYGAPALNQPAPNPKMFVPSQAPQVPQPMNFAPSPAAAQPPVGPFIPTTPAALRNVGQYQAPTLGSQLYPGPGNPNYLSGPTGGGSLAPNPPQAGPSVGFMPSTNPGIQRPGMGPTQPSSPIQPAQLQPIATPAAPPPTVQTVDTSNVPVQQRSVITTLTRLFNETSEALGGSRANPAKKREIEDNSRKIGALFAKLNGEDISKNAAEKLVQLCQALDSGDFTTALQIQVQLTTSDWDECNFWLATLKRMIKTRQNAR